MKREVLTLVVEGYPLRLSSAFDASECDSAVIAINTRHNGALTCKILLTGQLSVIKIWIKSNRLVSYSFLLEGVARCRGIFAKVGSALNRRPLSGFAESVSMFTTDTTHVRSYTSKSYTSCHSRSSVFFLSSMLTGSQMYRLSQSELESH
jgi:hypothetical protein